MLLVDDRGSDVDLAGLTPPMDQGGYDPGPPPSDDRFDGPRRGGGGGRGKAFDRVPPHSLEAEVSVLGAAMLSQHAASTVTEVLNAEDFYRSAHGVVFEAIQSLISDGTAVDTISVLEWIRDRHRVDEIGGPAAVTDLVAATPTSANAEYYANVVREKALLRRLIEAGTNVVRMGYEDTEDPLSTIGRAESEVLRVSDVGARSEYSALSELLVPAFKRLEQLSQDNSEVTGLATGFDDLDRLTAGLQPENLIIVAARPAMGKCLTGDARIQLADGGTLSLQEVVERGARGERVELLAFDDTANQLVPVAPTEFHDNGTKVVHEVETQGGRSITATANHPFLTPYGWRRLDELQPEDRIAATVPRHSTPREGAAMVSGGNVVAAPPRIDVVWDRVATITTLGPEQVYDVTVPVLHNFVANDLVVHNSSFSLNLAQYVTVSLKKPAIVFSLEMSKIEIVNRMLSAEAGIDSKRIKTGRFDDRDWRRLSDALGRLSEAPLFIDDTPSISMLEIAAKCRRLKQKSGLELVIIDYLQLMQSHRNVDNRQQEVAEISRGLKMLAKDLQVPVIALSQLSRQPESRVDKRPMLADLRESGCLTRSTRLFRADTGQPITFGELLDDDVRDIQVWARDEHERLVPGRLTHAFPSGTKRVFRVRLRSGMVVEATANHPFLTLDGWQPLGDLQVGGRVGAARTIPEPLEPTPMDPDEVVLLAHMIGEGTMVARQPVHYTSADPANLEAVEKAAWQRFGITARHDADGRSEVTTQLHLPSPHRLTHGVRNPIAAWLDELGLWDRRSYEKHVPAEVFGLPDGQVRLFLHHLWATDGCVWVRPDDQSGPPVRLYYATASEQLARDVQLLLLRMGVTTTIARPNGRPGTRQQFHVTIAGAANQSRFLQHVGCHGTRGDLVPQALAALADVPSNPNRDTVPREVWDRVRDQLREQGITHRRFAELRGTTYGGSAVFKNSVGRDRLADVAEILDDDRLRDLATSDLLWDEIVEIEDLGEQEVYDATVEGHHSFVAEGVVLHNSIEQDADIVGFIYRDEVYDEHSPDKGIAELIIAKHRNGQVATVRLAFLGHLTKFANLKQTGRPGGDAAGGPPPAPPPDSPL